MAWHGMLRNTLHRLHCMAAMLHPLAAVVFGFQCPPIAFNPGQTPCLLLTPAESACSAAICTSSCTALTKASKHFWLISKFELCLHILANYCHIANFLPLFDLGPQAGYGETKHSTSSSLSNLFIESMRCQRPGLIRYVHYGAAGGPSLPLL